MALIDPTVKVWFSAAEATDYTGYSLSTIERAVASGELEFSQRRRGGPRRFHRSNLDAFVRGEPAGPVVAALPA